MIRKKNDPENMIIFILDAREMKIEMVFECHREWNVFFAVSIFSLFKLQNVFDGKVADSVAVLISSCYV